MALPRLPALGLTALALFALGLIALCVCSVAAQAHAVLLASVPAVGGTVPEGPTAIRLRFNSLVDHARSRLTLVGPDRNETVLSIDPDAADEVLASQANLVPGASILRWQVLAVDGHITRGEVAVTVLAAPPPPKGR